MKFLSLFSGIDAASVAWMPLGWSPVAFAEVDKFPSAVLRHHYPTVPNLGDVTKITQEHVKGLGLIDLVVFGFPCQDLSVAGKRAGLHHQQTGERTRSGLFFDAMRIVRWTGARWAVAENVPGLFSSNGGRDFAAVAGEMAGVHVDVPDGGWANSGVLVGPDALVEWATLDAQYFGVPQRRRRVFIIRDAGNWRGRPPLFLVPHSLSGHPAPRRETRQSLTHDLAPSLTGSGRGTERTGESRGQDPVVAVWPAETAPTLDAHYGDKFGYDDQHIAGVGGLFVGQSPPSGPRGRADQPETSSRTCSRSEAEASSMGTLGGFPSSDHLGEANDMVAHSLRAEGFDASEDGTGRGTPLVPVAFQDSQSGMRLVEQQATLDSNNGSRRHNGVMVPVASPTLRAEGNRTGGNRPPGTDVVMTSNMAVRRLTPRECEKLQGFSPGYTKISDKTADGPRYKALGNSMAVPVMRWIGQRIQMVDDLP